MGMWTARGVRVGCILVTIAIAVTCVQSNSDRCAGGLVCPEGTRCRALVTPELMTCVSDDQVTACSTIPDGSGCKVEDVDGTCFGGACYPATCGDRIVDVTEACDDGNRDSDDGCSANCLSREQCGDGLIDLLRAEQCDDGRVGISGDGCSSRCVSEIDLWQQVESRQPGERTHVGLATDPVRGVLMFGGSLGSGGSNAVLVDETWRWGGTSWLELTPPQDRPSRRTLPAIAYDPGRNRVVMFGGTGPNSTPLGDTWEWDGHTWTRRTPAVSPSPRVGAAMACGPARCVLVGGAASAADLSNVLTDVWTWDGTTWTPTIGGPGPLHDAAFAFDSDRQVFVLYGGTTAGGVLTETWELSDVWTRITTVVFPPNAAKPVAAYDKARKEVVLVTANATWTYGQAGWANKLQPPNMGSLRAAYDDGRSEVLAFDAFGVTKAWNGTIWSPRPVSVPTPTGTSLATFDPETGRLILVNSSRTYGWNGTTWEVLAQGGLPTIARAALTYDRACKRAVHVGGGVGSAASRETWTFDGTWLQSPDTGLTARTAHAMTYDLARDAVVVFGGIAPNSTELGDTWEWTGACGAKTWANRAPASGPPPRGGAAMVYDPIRRVSVMFGGASRPSSPLDDTWEWDGSAWTAKASATSPPARFDHAMTYDPRRRAVILFGGTNGPVTYRDTWKWDGSAWTEISALAPPPPRSQMTLAPDSTGNLVVIGGAPSTTDLAWRLQSSSNDPIERCRLATSDGDGDGLRGCADPDCWLRCKPLCPLDEACGDPFPRCGDGTCSAVEDYLICPPDCTAP